MKTEQNNQYELFNGETAMALLALLDGNCDSEAQQRFKKYLKAYAGIHTQMPAKFKESLQWLKEAREERGTYDEVVFEEAAKTAEELYVAMFKKRKGKRNA